MGLTGVTGNTRGVSQRMADTINGTGALDINAQVVNEGVKLTQGSTAYSGNTPIESPGINGVTTPPFIGGAKVGIQNVTNDLEAIAERVGEAVTNHFNPTPRADDNMLAHWKFNEGRGGSSGDRLERNGNTMTPCQWSRMDNRRRGRLWPSSSMAMTILHTRTIAPRVHGGMR